MKLKYLITGTGGCGTLSTTMAFHRAGFISEHEKAFNVSGLFPNLDSYTHEMEASWMATHHLARLPEGVFVVHLVRHPFRVTESIYDAGMFVMPGLAGYSLFTHNALQSLHDYPSAWDKTAHLVVEWNKRVEPYADIRHRIEDGIPALMGRLGIEFDPDTDRRYHASGKVHPELKRGMIQDELWLGLEELVERYGY